MSTLTLTTIPAEIVAFIFEYFVDDHETLERLSKAHPSFAPPANAVRHSIRRVLVRGNGAQEACKELVESLHRSQNGTQSDDSSTINSSDALIGPIRYLELVFDSRAEFRLADATQGVLDSLPAVRHVTLKINARPFPETPYQEVIADFEEKVRGAVQDYSTLMGMLNTLKPHRRIGMSLILNDCMLRSSPIIAQQYPNIVLREFDVKYYLYYANTMVALAERLVYATKTLTDMTILEDPRNGWQYCQSPRMPFSGLSALKRLQIPASLWFEEAAYSSHGGPQGFLWKREGTIRPSVVHLLPSSISSLRVDFTGSSGIFAVGTGYREAFSRMTSDEAKMKMKPAWEWIYELAAHPSQFPYLKHVAVLELKNLSGEMARGARAYKPDVSVDWDPPLELKKAFEDKGMELRIQIRGKEVAVSTRQERDNSSVIAA
jgi:hypothetical protein